MEYPYAIVPRCSFVPRLHSTYHNVNVSILGLIDLLIEMSSVLIYHWPG